MGEGHTNYTTRTGALPDFTTSSGVLSGRTGFAQSRKEREEDQVHFFLTEALKVFLACFASLREKALFDRLIAR